MAKARPPSHDERHLARALELAERGRGRTSPNPTVGCVLVKGTRVVGEGWHRRLSGAHAEVEALKKAGRAARGATCYVTLEPCNHQGRTGPCSQALLAAGVAEVVYGATDPAEGRGGARSLRRAGIPVRRASGDIGARCTRSIAGFLSRVHRDRPLITLKVALTLDGRIATAAGQSAWLTSPGARAHTRALRGRYDALLTGIGTVLADDPRLTVRQGDRTLKRQPLRVVVDSRARMRPAARMLQEPGAVLVATTAAAAPRDLRRLEKAGAEVMVLSASGDRVSLTALLTLLAQRGCNDVWVEAGGALNGALLAAGLVDRVVAVMAPMILGADARAAFQLPGPRDPADAWRLEVTDLERLGPDLLLRADVRESRADLL